MLPAMHSKGTDRTAPPIVLIHGFLSSADKSFGRTGWISQLSSIGRRGIAVDLPGHGTNTAPINSAAACTSAIVRILAETITTEYPDESVDVVGYSLGSRLAWELPTHGTPVRRLVLGGLSLTDPFAGLTATELNAALQGKNTDERSAMVASFIANSRGDSHSLAALVEGLGSEPFDVSRNAPAVPTLLVGGSDDPLVRGIAELAPTLPRGQYVLIPGDHDGAAMSAEFQEAALRFLA